MSQIKLHNKVIKGQLVRSKSLKQCGLQAHLHFSWLLEVADDHGCFEIDIEDIRGLVYAKYLKEVSEEDIAEWLNLYEKHGMLFRWKEEDKEYGFFVKHDIHSGEYLSRRRKRETFEPPEKELMKYLQKHSIKFKSIQNGSIVFKSPQKTSKHSKSSPESESESESETESEPEPKEGSLQKTDLYIEPKQGGGSKLKPPKTEADERRQEKAKAAKNREGKPSLGMQSLQEVMGSVAKKLGLGDGDVPA